MNTTQRTALALSLLAVSAVTLAADKLVPLNIKPGAWEMTTRTIMQGSMVPADRLAKMSPEQRAKSAAMMQARSGRTNTHVFKECLTAQELQKQEQPFPGPEGEGCTRTVTTNTPTRQEYSMICPANHGGHGGTSTMTVDASSPTALHSVADQTRASGGNVHVEVDSRWLGASCSGI